MDIVHLEGAVFPRTNTIVTDDTLGIQQGLCLYEDTCVGDGTGNYYAVSYTVWYSCDLVNSQPNGTLRIGGAANGQRTTSVFTTPQNCTGSYWDMPGNYLGNNDAIIDFSELPNFCGEDDLMTIEVPVATLSTCTSTFMMYPYDSSFNSGTFGYLNGCFEQTLLLSFNVAVSHVDLLCVTSSLNHSFPVECSPGGVSICSTDNMPNCDSIAYGSHQLQFVECSSQTTDATSSTFVSTTASDQTTTSTGLIIHVGWLFIIGLLNML